MKRWISGMAVTLLALAVTLGLPACGKHKDEPPTTTRPTYQAETLSECLRLDAYTDLSVTLRGADEAKGEAIWKIVLQRAEVLFYPEDAVAYYVEQERAACRYYAEQNHLSYEEALTTLGISEERIAEQAREMVKADLVYEYIRQDAAITLTEKEKSSLFDRYARRLAAQHGYDADDVKEHMEALVYEAMLYDKTMEYLIVHNEFVVAE